MTINTDDREVSLASFMQVVGGARVGLSANRAWRGWLDAGEAGR